MSVPPGGFAPLMFMGADGRATGLMSEVLIEIAAARGYQVQGVEAPRKRVEVMILDGQLDAVARAREWTTEPARFVFTEPVARVRDLIVFDPRRPVVYRAPPSLFGLRVGTHLGYSYPALDPHFAAGQIVREDAHTETAMLRMLQAGRIDVAVVNEWVALWLMKTERWETNFAFSPSELDGYDFRFMFGRAWAGFVEQFNADLARMRSDGRLARQMARWR